MKREFVELPGFRTDWKLIGLTDNDLFRLEDELVENPKSGSVIKGTGGVRKLRFPLTNRGKSRSARVIYVDFEAPKKTYFLAVYLKKERENLTDEQCAQLQMLVRRLKNISR